LIANQLLVASCHSRSEPGFEIPHADELRVLVTLMVLKTIITQFQQDKKTTEESARMTCINFINFSKPSIQI
jgi:hypothetical protein